MGLSEVIFDLWEAKFDLWEARSGVGDPRSRVWEAQIRDQDPDFDLKEAKICGPKTDFPYGRANFDLWEVKTRLIWPILGLEGPKRPISGIPAWKR